MDNKPIIINVYEADSDGDGTPCEVMIRVDRPVSDEDMETVESAISDFQVEMKTAGTEWETKTLATVAIEKLTSLGYECEFFDFYRVIEIS